MRPLRSGEDLLGGARVSRWRGESGVFQADRLAAATLKASSATLPLDEEEFDLDIRISLFGDATEDTGPVMSGAGTCPTGACTYTTCNQSDCTLCGPTRSNCHGC